jgi:spore germination protein KA
MIRFLLRKFGLAHLRKESPSTPEGKLLHSDLEENLALFREELGNSPDVIIRRFTLNLRNELKSAVLFIDGLIDQQVIYDSILYPLMIEAKKEKWAVKGHLIDFIEDNLLTVGGVDKDDRMPGLVAAVLAGDSVLLVDGCDQALAISTKGWEKRSITEPDTEQTIKGPREGFTENIRTNTAMLRRKIADPGLKFEQMKIGERTRTKVSIAYVKGIVNEKLVEEVRRRLKRINTDMVLDANYLSEFISDAPFSPFPTVAFTERPDVTAAKLLEGRVAIFVDGTPVVNTAPTLFIESFQNPDDYNFHFLFATMIRWIRYLAFFLGILLPAFFVALTTYHQELIPTPLLISMAAAMEGVPFPIVIEVVAMGAVFEILREAGVRLARPIGQTISIVGALVIGQATVAAGLVAAPTVIVIALTAIASFVVPTQQEIGIILRLGLTFLAGILGAYGILVGLLLTLIHLTSLRSFGVPYLSPVIPLSIEDQKDVIVRTPLWAMWTRPRSIGWPRPIRQGFGQSPTSPEETVGKDWSRPDDKKG